MKTIRELMRKIKSHRYPDSPEKSQYLAIVDKIEMDTTLTNKEVVAYRKLDRKYRSLQI